MTRSVVTTLVLMMLAVGIPACGAVSFAFCTGWFCYGWEPYPPPCYPGWCYSSAALTVVDLNDDGHDDILAAGPATSTLTVLLGNGQGEFVSGRGYTGNQVEGIDRLVTGRFDDDAFEDVATLDAERDEVRIFRGDGTGSFELAATRALSSTGVVRALLKGDLDGAGVEELLVVESAGRVSRVSPLGSAPTATALRGGAVLGSGVTTAQLADLDGDGAPDLVVADEFAETIEVWLGTSDGSFDAPIWSAATGGRPAAIVVTRLDDDTDLDLAILDGLDGEHPRSRRIVPGDFNEDGVPDLAFPGGPRNAVGVAFGGARQP